MDSERKISITREISEKGTISYELGTEEELERIFQDLGIVENRHRKNYLISRWLTGLTNEDDEGIWGPCKRIYFGKFSKVVCWSNLLPSSCVNSEDPNHTIDLIPFADLIKEINSRIDTAREFVESCRARKKTESGQIG